MLNEAMLFLVAQPIPLRFMGRRNLQFQLTTIQKQRKLGEHFYTEEMETEEQISKDADTYIDKLYTLLLAYALAGAEAYRKQYHCRRNNGNAAMIPEVQTLKLEKEQLQPELHEQAVHRSVSALLPLNS